MDFNLQNFHIENLAIVFLLKIGNKKPPTNLLEVK